MRNEGIDRSIAAIAARQSGVFSRRQAQQWGAERGLIQHRLRTGRWEKVAHNVFRVAGAPVAWRQSLFVALLAWGDEATISHRAAGALGRLATLQEGFVELSVPPNRKGRGPGIVHRSQIPVVDVTAIGGIRVTTPARTLLDLATVCPIHQVEEALDDALRRRMVSINRLRWRLDELGRRPGVEMMRALIAAREGVSVPQSVFETRLLRLLKKIGLPRPKVQYPVPEANAVLDFAYPDRLLAMETDGYRWHSARLHFESDRARSNRLIALHWRVMHVTWRQLHEQPEETAETIYRLYLEATSRRSAGTL